MTATNFPIRSVLQRCAAAIEDFPPAAMFGLRDEGYASLYEQLISCILSIRTYDEVSTVASRRLFDVAYTPDDMVKLSAEELGKLIYDTTFPGQKIQTILRVSQQIIDEYNGETPASFAQLTAFKGVGPKCANLALGVALGQPVISVDVHVHRITNRWGYVQTKTPEKTMAALYEKLPEDLRVEINRVLVPFGKHICQGRKPKCATCPVQTDCAQVGVS